MGKRTRSNSGTAPHADAYVVFDEDRHQNRTGAGPQVMASLRNLALSLLRLDGCDNVAKALRHNGRDYERPLELLLAC